MTPPDSERCTGRVHLGGRGPGFRRCVKRAWKDGFCSSHHPDEKERRNKARMDEISDAMRRRQEARVVNALRDATLAQIFSELERRGISVSNRRKQRT